MAWKRRSRPCGLEAAVAALLGAAACGIAFDDEQLVILPLAAGAGGKLAHEGRGFQLAGLADVIAGFAGSLAGLGGADGLRHDGGGHFLVFQIVEPVGELLGDDGLHRGADLAAAQAALGLTLELRILDHGGEDAGEAFAEILAGKVVVLFLQEADPAGIIIKALGEGRFETGLMGTALGRIDIVDIGEEALRIAVGILDGGTADDGIPLAFEIDHIILQGGFPGIEIKHIVGDSAVIAEDAGTAFRIGNALVGKGDADAAVQISQFLQAAGNGLGMKLHIFEDLVIREETDQGPLFAGVSHGFKRADRLAGFDLPGGGVELAGEGHAVMGPVEEHVHGEPLAQGVDHAGANAVQTAGVIVILVVELAARVQDGENDLDPGDAHGRMCVDRHAAAVVIDAGGAVLMQGDGDLGGKAVGGFIDCVVHDLPKQMMETAG